MAEASRVDDAQWTENRNYVQKSLKKFFLNIYTMSSA